MQNCLKQNDGRKSRLLRLVLTALSLVGTMYAAQPDAAVISAPPVSRLSEFIDDPKIGKDPFFPNSTRRQVTNDTKVVIESVANISNWKLQGLSGNKEHRLAIISTGSAFYRTMSAGEEVEVKIDAKAVKVQCLEIRDHSVVLKVNGQTQELKINQRF